MPEVPPPEHCPGSTHNQIRGETILALTQLTLDALQRRLQVMDSTAFSLCLDNKMPIIVFDFFQPHNLKRIVLGEKVGTLVS